VIDTLRRRLTVDRITSHIAEAAERLVEGDFSVRVDKPAYASMSEDMSSVIDSFNKMAEELAGVETLRGDFISSVSHEMKTPLSVISNYATLLSSPELSEEKRLEYADIIKRSTKRMSDMMTNILKLNRLENQQIYPRAERFDLGESLSECFLSYESVWEKKGIEIETHIEDEIFVEADEELLSLVWNNLFSNAFKFTEEGGKVTLILTANESSAIVRVADTGCGMSSEVGSRIFDKFYQGDSSRATEGNGLGLALVKKVIDIMQGGIYVESELGRGSIFTVVFKRCKENKINKNS
jgi:signal transduction histidine kinase